MAWSLTSGASYRVDQEHCGKSNLVMDCDKKKWQLVTGVNNFYTLGNNADSEIAMDRSVTHRNMLYTCYI